MGLALVLPRVAIACMSVGLLLVRPDACFGAVPTVADVLKVARENRKKLDPLHMQFTHTEERTDAWVIAQERQAFNLEMLIKALDDKQAAADLEKQVPGISSPAYRRVLQNQIKVAKELAPSVRFKHQYEAFIRGENYQLRSEVYPHKEGFAFPNVRLTPESLVNEYARVRIYSRLEGRKPLAQIWPGQNAAYAIVSSQHITDNMRFAPFMAVMQPDKYEIHAIDHFFSARDGAYRVVGEEERDGRRLTIVEVSVPTGDTSQVVGDDGKPRTAPEAYVYRAWLDLAQGGLPIETHFQYGVADRPNDKSFHYPPTRVIKTTEIKQLANGGFFPATTIVEEFSTDPDAPQLSEAEWKEVRDGKRKAPPNVVHVRHTWKTLVIDANLPQGNDFFVLQFPEGQKFWDLDTQKVVGSLPTTPALKPGVPAPALKIARWLDGKEHSLEEFRGKVVMLRFWALSDKTCREALPRYTALEKKFRDQPVVFISVHWADKDTKETAVQIEKYAREQDWHYLAAIDAGTMIEDSATLHEYGCVLAPTEVIIGPDGRIAYNGAMPAPELEGVWGKICDEVTPEDEAKFNAYMRGQFVAVGEKWPMEEGMSHEEMMAVFNRVETFQLSQRIKEALESKRR